MLTVRVDRAANGKVSRDVFECTHYTASYDQARTSVRVMLFNRELKHEVQLGGGDEAYVMNEIGNTVDIFRTRKSR